MPYGPHSEAVDRWPLAWPVGWKRTPPSMRQIAPFGTKEQGSYKRSMTVATAVQRLVAELDRLRAVNPTLSTNVPLRIDGFPRSDENPTDPGAAVYFSFRGKATVLACDRYRRVADNITAIAAHIEALRRIERHGVGTIEQALAGYKALPADSAADWRAVLGLNGMATVADVERSFKMLAKKRHPDVAGGSDEAMMQLNRAREFALLELTP